VAPGALSVALDHARDEERARAGREATVTEAAGHLRRSPEGSKRDSKPPKCRRLPALEEQRHDGDEDTGTIADTVGHDDCDWRPTLPGAVTPSGRA
jgi:hypothetical protein